MQFLPKFASTKIIEKIAVVVARLVVLASSTTAVQLKKYETAPNFIQLKFMFSKKVTKIDEIFTVDLTLCTLTCQIIVQVTDFSEINKCVGPNKAVQEGFFLIYVGKNQDLKEKSQK